MTGDAFDSRAPGAAPWLWIGFVALAGVGLSRAFACAMPFAGLATLAAFTLKPRHACALVIAAWLANQAIGFGLLHYPRTGPTLAWGVAIGLAALWGLGTALAVAARPAISLWISVPAAFIAAFATYELVLFAATWLLPSGSHAFAPAVVLRIVTINTVALFLLLAIDLIVGPSGLRRRVPRGLQFQSAHDGFLGDGLATGRGWLGRPGRGLRSRLSHVWRI